MKERNWLDNDNEVKDFIAFWGLYEGEGLEEAFNKWKKLPKEERTEKKLESICKNTAKADDIDLFDPPDWIPRL